MRLLLWSILLGAGSALAQAPADSTAAQPQSLSEISRRAMADSDSSAVDEDEELPEFLKPKTGFLGWLDSWQRFLTFTVNSNAQQRVGTIDFQADLDVLDGQTSSSWTRAETEHRQQDRSGETSNLLTTYRRSRGDGVASLDLTLSRNTLDDVTRLITGDEVRITNEINNLNLGVKGGGKLAKDFSFDWGAAGIANQDETTNRGNTLSSDRLGAAASGRWTYLPERFTKVVAKFGYERRQGDRSLRGRQADATTVQDTVGTDISIYTGPGTTKLSLNRISFIDERLDWRRNVIGQPDTTNVPFEEQFGEEREKRDADDLKLVTDLNLPANFSYHAEFATRAEERSTRYSREGFLSERRSNWQHRLSVEYLPGATASLEYSGSENWTNRRSLDDELFRGRETRREDEFKFKIRQPVFAKSTIEFNGQQLLEKQIYEDRQNNGDRDRFTERMDAALSATPFEDLEVTVSGILARTDEINIRTERVGNNRGDRHYEVRGGYDWMPNQRFKLGQVYRQQIVFRDFHLSDDRDEFNKQGQFSTNLHFGPPAGKSAANDDSPAAAPAGVNVDFGHILRFRQNGRRAQPDLPFDNSYTTTLRRFDHTFTADVSIPISIWTIGVAGQRGHVVDTAGRGGRRTEEDGQLAMQLRGIKSWRLGLISATIDIKRVLAFGPRIRPENEDYWAANSSLSVRF